MQQHDLHSRSGGGRLSIAVVQHAPVFLDLGATVEKACVLISEAGAAGAQLIVFPEAFVPAFPFWVTALSPGERETLGDLYAELMANAVTIPGPATERLGAAARAAGVHVAIGVNERNAEASGGSLYNTYLLLDSDGQVIGKRRKLVPTAGERLVWAAGDGSTFQAFDLGFARVGALICWENYMPLARYALYSWGIEILLAPTWARNDVWLATLRHIAKEGAVFVVGCSIAQRRDTIPDRHRLLRERYTGDSPDWINRGNSCVVEPSGEFLVHPLAEREEILHVEVNLDAHSPREVAAGRGRALWPSGRLPTDRAPTALADGERGGWSAW